jgi:hypothetical protein
MELTSETTPRGFGVFKFKDRYGSECSLQESSLATESAVWLGVDKDFNGNECTRMHLTRKQVASLLPALTRFVQSGSLVEHDAEGYIEVGQVRFTWPSAGEVPLILGTRPVPPIKGVRSSPYLILNRAFAPQVAQAMDENRPIKVNDKSYRITSAAVATDEEGLTTFFLEEIK